MGSSLLLVTIWVENAEVLKRAKQLEVDDNVQQHLVLDYDLWKTMASLQALINTPPRWKKETLI